MSDVTLTIGIKSGSLTKSIQDEINAAAKKNHEIKIVASKKALTDSIRSVGGESGVTVNIKANKSFLRTSLNKALTEYAPSKGAQIKVNVDADYIRKQIESAIKGVGNVGQGTNAVNSTSSHNAELEQEIALINANKRAYSELGKNINAINHIASGSPERKNLKENAEAIRKNINAYNEVKGDVNEYSHSLSKLSLETTKNIVSAKENNRWLTNSAGLIDKLKAKLSSISTVVHGFSALRTVFKPIVDSVKEVDTAMAQLRIVSQENESAMASYQQRVLEIANHTAGSVSDLIDATTTYSRLGYSLDEASKLAEYTAMLQNVGDIDVSTATDAITSIAKAYNKSADEIESVMDRLVKTGNNFPVSVSELSQGITNAGSMLSIATGGNLDKSLALLTAANTTIQNISKSSTGLRTIVARIRNVKSELDDLGEEMTTAKYDKIVKTLSDNNASITDQTGQLRDVFDVLKDLSVAYQEMSANEKSALATEIAGTRQQNVLNSLLMSFNEAENAMIAMSDSEGEMERANEKYLDTIEARMQRLKNAFTEMAQSLLTKETINKAIDIIRGLTQFLSSLLKGLNSIGGLRTLLPTILAFAAVFKGNAIVSSLQKMHASFDTFKKNAQLTFESARNSMNSFGTSMTTAAKTTVSAAEMINSALGIIGIAATVASLIASLVQGIIDSSDEKLEGKINAGETASSEIKELESAYDNYTQLTQSGTASTEELSKSLDTLASSLGVSRDYLDQTANSAGSYRDAIRDLVIEQEKLKQIKVKDAIDAAKEKLDKGILDPMTRTMNQVSMDIMQDDWGWARDRRGNERNWYFENILGINPDDIKESSDWIKYIDQIGAKLLEVKNKYGENHFYTTATKNLYDNLKYNFSELIPLMEDYEAQQKQINTHAIEESLDDLNTTMPKTQEEFKKMRAELIASVFANENFDKSTQDAVSAVDEFLSNTDGYRDFYASVVEVAEASDAATKGIEGIKEMAVGASEALSELDDALKGNDWDTDLEKRVEHYKSLLEEIEKGNVGTEYYKKAAEAFNVDTTLPIEQQIDFIKSLGVYYEDAEQGISNFLNRVHELSGTDLSNMITYDPTSGEFWFDPSKLDEIATKLKMNRDMLVGMLEALRAKTPIGEWVDYDAQSLQNMFDTLKGGDGTITKIGDSFYLNKQKLDSFASSAGYDAQSLIDTLKTLDEYSDIDEHVIDFVIDPDNTVRQAESELLAYAQDLRDLGAEAPTIAQIIASSLSNLPAEYVIDILANLPPELHQIKDQIYDNLPAEVRTEIEANTEQADGAIAQTTKALEELGDVAVDVDGTTIHIYVSDNGTIQNFKNRLSEIIQEASTKGIKVEQENAGGTQNAKDGLSLLGDEYSASGNPRPELVVSGDRAYIAGINGPVVSKLNAGDIVYTYKQTKEILGSNLKNIKSIPAFGKGRIPKEPTDDGATGTTSDFTQDDSSFQNTDEIEKWFEKQYKLHNHYRKLDKETDKAYLDWLENAYKQAYAEQQFDAEENLKYEEEVFDLKKQIFSDTIADQKHALAMGQITEEQYYQWLVEEGNKARKNLEMSADDYAKYQEEVYSWVQKTISEKINAQVDDKKHALAMEQITDEQYYKWLQKASDKWYKSGKIDADEYERYQEEIYSGTQQVIADKISKQVSDKKHALAMEQISDEQYYKWLQKASDKWYKSGKIDADEYAQYQEEIYSGTQQVIADKISKQVSDHKHSLAMEQITDEQYYKWLAKAADKWYKSGKIDADEYAQYQEEIYSGTQQVIADKISAQVSDKKHALAMEQISDEQYYKWLQKASNAWYKSGKIDLDEYEQYQEEIYSGMQQVTAEKISKQVDDHKHALAMEQISDEEYYKWLQKASNAWYKTGKINLDEYEQYQEEIYSGIQQVIADKISKQINDHKHALAMDQITDEQYYKWLAKASKKWYKTGKIDADEYAQYQEELYSGIQQVIADKISKQIDDHKHALAMDQISEDQYYKWLAKASKQWYKTGKIDAAEYAQYQEELYDYSKKKIAEQISQAVEIRKHAIAMDKMSESAYYKWLAKASDDWYKKGKISLDEWRQYHEEVYSGLKSIFDDYLGDISHRMEMLQNAGAPAKNIIAWAKTGMKAVEAEIAAASKRGLTNNDEYVQNLQQQWWTYYNEIKSTREEVKNNAESSVKELVDYRIKMLQKEMDEEKDSLNTRLKDLQDFYSKQKDMLQDAHDEEKYQEEQAEKRKNVSDIQIQLDQLSMDNSAWAQKKKLELLQQLADAQKELDDFEKEHALQSAQEKIDGIQQLQEEELNQQIESIDKASQSMSDLYAQALLDVKSAGKELYDQMVEFNNIEGSGNPADVAQMWNDAYTALEAYTKLYGGAYKGIAMSYGKSAGSGKVDTSKINAGGTPKKDGGLSGQQKKEEPKKNQQTSATNQKSAGTVKSSSGTNQKSTGTVKSSNGTALPAKTAATKPALNASLRDGIASSIYTRSGDWGSGSADHENRLKTVFANERLGAQFIKEVLARVQLFESTRRPTINKGDSKLANYAYSKLRKTFRGYASGTRNAYPGLHRINERGDEAIFKALDGSTYKLFSGGEHVFDNKATEFLHDFSDNPASILSGLLREVGVGSTPSISGKDISQNISLGDIYIQGDASQKTISDIRREKRAEMDYMLKELNRLKK